MTSRNLSLASRRENTRDIVVHPPVKIFAIDEIEAHFRENIASVEYKFAVVAALREIDKPEEADDVLRTQIVFLESAFDFYLHEIVKLGIVCMFKGFRDKTDKYDKLMIEMHYLERALSESEDYSWLRDWINKEFSSKTLMSFDSFNDVCKLLGLNIKNIADGSFYEEGSRESTSKKLKNFLSELYRKRNVIAHQSDRRLADAERQTVAEEYVRVSIQHIKDIVKATGDEFRTRYENI